MSILLIQITPQAYRTGSQDVIPFDEDFAQTSPPYNLKYIHFISTSVPSTVALEFQPFTGNLHWFKDQSSPETMGFFHAVFPMRVSGQFSLQPIHFHGFPAFPLSSRSVRDSG
jgi:hypothetical protein